MGSQLSLPHLKRRPARGPTWVAGVLALLVVGLGASVALAAPPPMPKNAKARKHFDAAVERYTEQDFDGAVEQANKGLAIEEHESLLFILAQAERQRGNCVEAVAGYTRFIELTESEDMRQNALTAKALCAEELAELARQAELAAQQAEAEAETEPEPEPVAPPPPPPTPWYRDPLGGALVGVGGAGVIAGVAVVAAGAAQRSKLEAAPDYEAFVEQLEVQRRLYIAGGITAGVGALVAGGGVVRWVLVAKQAKQEQANAAATARVRLGPWVDGRRAGVVLSGRF